mmetsp:Transcript_92361/g.247086  ORF Transcript_92361/g.247086 Transcript_92361/m.247086 type:complete len:217 (+) Transcript_92361:78-728(+)
MDVLYSLTSVFGEDDDSVGAPAPRVVGRQQRYGDAGVARETRSMVSESGTFDTTVRHIDNDELDHLMEEGRGFDEARQELFMRQLKRAAIDPETGVSSDPRAVTWTTVGKIRGDSGPIGEKDERGQMSPTRSKRLRIRQPSVAVTVALVASVTVVVVVLGVLYSTNIYNSRMVSIIHFDEHAENASRTGCSKNGLPPCFIGDSKEVVGRVTPLPGP